MGMRSTYGADLTIHTKYPTFPACPALYLWSRPKNYLHCILKLKQNTFATGADQMRQQKWRRKRSSVSQTVEINKWPLRPRPLVNVCGFHVSCSASQIKFLLDDIRRGGRQGKELWMESAFFQPFILLCLVRCTCSLEVLRLEAVCQCIWSRGTKKAAVISTCTVCAQIPAYDHITHGIHL